MKATELIKELVSAIEKADKDIDVYLYDRVTDKKSTITNNTYCVEENGDINFEIRIG